MDSSITTDDDTNVVFDSISFDTVFSELQKYQEENNGSLTIPASHPSLSRIVDNLTSSGFESLSKKRWEDQMSSLRTFQRTYGDCQVPITHPTLGEWVKVQRDQYKRHEQRMPNALTKKRILRLKDVGFDSCEKPAAATTNEGSAGERQAEERQASSSTDDELAQSLNDFLRGEMESMNAEENITAGLEADQSQNNEGRNYQDERSGDTNGAKSAGTDQSAADNTNKIAGTREATSNKTAPGRQNESTEPKGESDSEETHAEETSYPGRITGKMKGKCDVCNQKDKFRGHKLQECKQCGVKVHELCYCMTQTNKPNPDFVCHACKAVGTSIEVNVPSRVGGCGRKMGKDLDYLTQEKRPDECILCSYSGGIHAMHPVYDTHGKKGRQLVLPAHEEKGRRLAWAHTLCAQSICTYPNTAGCVYGCDIKGRFEGDDSQLYDEDTKVVKHFTGDDGVEKPFNGFIVKYSKKRKLYKVKYEDGDSEELTNDEISDILHPIEQKEELMNTHHFVIASKTNGEENDWTKAINKHRHELICFVCGEHDKHSLRIPVQCIAGDENELEEFKERHPSLEDGCWCSVGMHVGCAKWRAPVKKINGRTAHSIYFFPGQQPDYEDENDDFTETVTLPYCTAHADEIQLNNDKGKKNKNLAKAQKKISGHKRKTRDAARATRAKRMRVEKKSNAQNLEKINGRANSKRYVAELRRKNAQSSFKKSLNSITNGSSNVFSQTKKSSGHENAASHPKFGTSPGEMTIGFSISNQIQYPARGRSQQALAKAPARDRQTLQTNNGNASAATTKPKKTPAGILRNNGKHDSGKRKHGSMPPHITENEPKENDGGSSKRPKIEH